MDDEARHENEMRLEQHNGSESAGTLENGRTTLDTVIVSDENENQINDTKAESVSGSDGMSGAPKQIEQDSINNNSSSSASSNDGSHISSSEKNCGEAASDGNSRTLDRNSNMSEEPAAVKDNKTSSKRTSKSRQDSGNNTSGNVVEESVALTPDNGEKDANLVQEEGVLEVPANCQQAEGKKLLQTLSSLIQQISEQTDASVLPLCPIQIAEAYVQEEEYEKTIQVIRLAKLYHEQQLANLSALQERWEAKWKAAVPCDTTPRQNSINDLNSEEIAKLVKFCASYQRPVVTANKLVTAESSLRSEGDSPLNVAGDQRDSPATAVTACSSGSEAEPGTDPGGKSGPEQQGMSQDLICDAEAVCSEPAGSAFSLEKEHKERRSSAESSPEAHAQSIGAMGRPCFDCGSFEDRTKGNHSVQLTVPEPCQDLLTAAQISEEEEKEFSNQAPAATDTLVCEGTGSAALVLSPAESDAPTGLRNCDGSGKRHVLPDGQLNDHVSELPHPAVDSKDAESRQDTNNSAHRVNGENEMMPEECERGVKEGVKETEVREEETGGQVNTELSDSFEESPEILCDHESSVEISPNVLQDQLPYNLADSVAFGDSALSLDDLAKRIEIEESTPAEGLISILKKRHADEGKLIEQLQQKQSKRRVRFEEPEDTLDQDENGSDSCLLLILLCIATVFLSIGGTALYCTFADIESSVCADFSNNVEFYYTQLQLGIEEMRHWASLS